MKYVGVNHLLLKEPNVSFLADGMLGSIARKLRFFGFDTLYIAHAHDNEILKIGIEQERVILTADKELFKRIVKAGARGVLVGRATTELEDLVDILTKSGVMFLYIECIGSRCSVCNGLLEERTSDQLKNDIVVVPSRVIAYYNQFFQCTTCGKIYWEGGHFESIMALARNLQARLIGRACSTAPPTLPSKSKG